VGRVGEGAVKRALAIVSAMAACSAPARRSIEIANVPHVDPIAPASASTPSEPKTPDLAAEATLVLPIPARDQAKEAPKSGWCGETAIQEGLLHLGVWAPQALINRAGHPKHPDLYSQEMPIALAELGVKYTFYAPKKAGFDAFAAFARASLDEGDPVIGGVKILPTEHPEWGLDHFVLIVGYGAKGLLVNTTWGSREWVGDATKGLSFHDAFYGIRLRGVNLTKDAVGARLLVVEEDLAHVTLRVRCDGLQAGKAYRIERRKNRFDEKAKWSATFSTTSDHLDENVTVDANEPARFQCKPASS